MTETAAVARHSTRRHAWLLFALTLLLFESSTRELVRLHSLATAGLFTTVLFAGVYSAGAGRSTLIGAIALGVPTVAVQWAAYFSESNLVDMADLVTSSAFLLYTIVVILRQVLSASRVTGDTILGGVVVYVLLGVMFLLLFSIAEQLEPGSFQGGTQRFPDEARGESFLLYFSFVTLTTLGYGDISPVGGLARALAMFEAIVGQLYLTILIAWLVGVRLSQYRLRE